MKLADKMEILETLNKEIFGLLLNCDISYFNCIQGVIYYSTINDQHTSTMSVQELAMRIPSYLNKNGYSFIISMDKKFGTTLRLYNMEDGFKIDTPFVSDDESIDTLLFHAFFEVCLSEVAESCIYVENADDIEEIEDKDEDADLADLVDRWGDDKDQEFEENNEDDRVRPMFDHIHYIGFDKGSDDGDYSSESYYDNDGNFFFTIRKK